MKKRKYNLFVTLITLFTFMFLSACNQTNSANTQSDSDKNNSSKTEETNVKLPKNIVIATDKAGGVSNVMANGIASVITEATEMRATVKGLGNLSGIVDQFEAGEIDFAVYAVSDPSFAYFGIGDFEEKYDFLRMVSVGANQTWSILVPEKYKDIRDAQDLKKWLPGKVMSHGWVNPVIDLYNNAAFANLGITEKDIEAMPVSNYDDYGAAWSEGRMDASGATIGAGILQQMYAAQPFHFVSLDDSPEAVKRMQEVEPTLYISKEKPGPVGVEEEINVLTYDYSLVVRKDLEDAVIQAVLQALYDNQSKIQTLPNLEKWVPADEKWVSERATLPYHEAAIEFYKKKELWNKEMTGLQEKWLSGNRY